MNNSRVVKRKGNASVAKIEPPKKALKKNELIDQAHALQEELTNLKEENRILSENQKKHIEAIHLLEETVTVLQSKKNDTEKEHKKTVDNLEETVKELRSKCANRSVYLCGECDYLANCVHDFNDHTHSQDDLESEENSQVDCKFCDESFGTLEEVMQHNKVKQAEAEVVPSSSSVKFEFLKLC